MGSAEQIQITCSATAEKLVISVDFTMWIVWRSIVATKCRVEGNQFSVMTVTSYMCYNKLRNTKPICSNPPPTLKLYHWCHSILIYFHFSSFLCLLKTEFLEAYILIWLQQRS
jgi:hypothetical protein